MITDASSPAPLAAVAPPRPLRERYLVTIAKRLAEARESAGLSQKDVSEATGIREPTVSRYENDRLNPSVEALTQLARLYRVTVEWLATGDDPTDSAAEPLPDYPGLTAFLETDQGRSVTPDELRTLRTLRASTGRPSVDTYRMMLMALRNTLER